MITWVLYDDPRSKRLWPLTRLRPASGLLLGAETLEERWKRVAGREEVRVVCRESLASLAEGRVSWRRALSADAEPGLATGRREGLWGDLWNEGVRWISDLVIPSDALMNRLREVGEDAALYLEGRLVGWRPGSGTARVAEEITRRSPGEGSEEVDRLLHRIGEHAQAKIELEGASLRGLGDLIRLQEPLLREDLGRLLERSAPTGVGDGSAYKAKYIRLEKGCRVDHGAVLDAREGPIVLARGCEVYPHTWIQGPLYAGAGCRLLGGRIGGGTTLGPQCRVRGEVEASVFLGYGNKAHDGFVGHSYLGEWVNLGAQTTTSDLKNNYSAISVDGGSGPEQTGLRKLGVFLGDHVKTRIGSLLTCGAVVGVGANLIGNPVVEGKWVPDFSWGSGEGSSEYEINKFLETAEIVLGRRGLSLTPAMAEALREVHRGRIEPGVDATQG